jgi:hypothetical protein
MPRIMKLEPQNAETEKLPPTFYLKFYQDEFAAFVANPAATLRELGQSVDNVTVTVRDHAWSAEQQEWVTDRSGKLFELPPSSSWEWWCYYSDEMCVCDAVIVVQ